MSWRTVIISNQSKLDYKMGFMVVRGEITRRVSLEEIAVLVLENPAVSDDYYSQTVELLSQLENHLMNISFDFSCDINYNKLDIGAIIKASGIEINDTYNSLGEKIIDYMELVTEFDRKKLYLTVNLRSYISDNEASEFMKTVLNHGYNVIMLESSEHTHLDEELRYIIDADLCEINY
ncbi:MAG: type II-A CRISPR-associated protein Csn2 [Ruminococcus sp.]|nr:type II-A CRISPR-associated protein Csn2 [Candidatus Copronaster equi]